ncbi:MAG: T9SS type A sorting domain-containing protein [Bacteroidetes bacterium]|nr:T9SS type A sorting domain-containing protein [Bacteroidota bacterium]
MKTIILLFIGSIFMNLGIFAQWSNDPSVNNAMSSTPGEQAIPKVATSINGITYLAWFSNESGNYNVRLQKLDVFGEIQWEEGGILISDHQAMTWLTDWDMTVDQEDCAILTFQDIRNVDNDVFAYRISPDGEFLWGADGIELSTGPAFDAAPKVCVTNSGNAIIAWSADQVVIRQKISPDGNKLWGENGITLSGANTYSWPQLLPVGEDDVIMKYFEDSGPLWAPTRHVYAQRYDADGNEVWDNAAIISNAGGIAAWTQVFSFINDGNDGFFIAWHDNRTNPTMASIYVQHIGADGSVLLGDDGTEASLLSTRQHFYAHLALPPGSDDIFVFWNEMDVDQNNRGIYGQKLSATGERLWGDNAKKFIEISPTDIYPYAAHNSNEDMVVFFEENPSANNAVIKAMRIDTDGNFVWTDDFIDICSLPSSKVHTVSGAFHDGQWISSWEDDRNGNKDIYAQNIKLDGTLGPVTISSDLTIIPDSITMDYVDSYPVYIINETSEPVEVSDIYFDPGYYIMFINTIPDLPELLNPMDTLEFNVAPIPGSNSYNPEEYVYETIIIESALGTYDVGVAINSDILGGQNDIITKEKLNIYPNPAKIAVNFDLSAAVSNLSLIKIYSADGTLKRQLEINNTDRIHWDLTNKYGNRVANGIYLYNVINKQGLVASGKIIIR